VAGWWLAELVAQGGGALGAALEADMRSGAGAAQAGKGLGAYLVGARWRQEGGE
jgi:hypothetical protein